MKKKKIKHKSVKHVQGKKERIIKPHSISLHSSSKNSKPTKHKISKILPLPPLLKEKTITNEPNKTNLSLNASLPKDNSNLEEYPENKALAPLKKLNHFSKNTVLDMQDIYNEKPDLGNDKLTSVLEVKGTHRDKIDEQIERIKKEIEGDDEKIFTTFNKKKNHISVKQIQSNNEPEEDLEKFSYEIGEDLESKGFPLSNKEPEEDLDIKGPPPPEPPKKKRIIHEEIKTDSEESQSEIKIDRKENKTSKREIKIEPSRDEDAMHAIRVKEKEVKGDVLEEYTIKLDGASGYIGIIKGEINTIYRLSTPKRSIATDALLNDLREELITMTSINMQELIDPKSFIAIKNKFKEEASKLLLKKVPTIESETSSLLIGILLQEMLGLGSIEFLINDPNLEEIVIVSAKEPLRVYTKKYGWLITNIILEKEETTINYANIIARRVGRQITTLSPLLDAHLVTGDRVNAVLYPINTKGNTIVIRKFARDPYTIIDLINNKTCDLETATLLWLAVEYEMNILISGGTASGKTVLLNACMPFIPPNQRIISIEDTKELLLPDFLYWTPLVTRLPNAEGKGAVTMIDLLVNSLRMRPDRIILGEMRRREEAMVLFEAMHTGHSVYATLHADSATETISRLTHPPLDIPANLLGAVNLNVVMFRDRRRGIRRVFQIAEIETAGDTAKANTLYRWSPDTDTLVKHNKSSKFFEDISRHTSMSETEINKELQLKKRIITWLISHKVRNLDDLGRTINLYYQNKDLLLKKMEMDDIKFILDYEK
ncbi:CpaF family protein [Candidatus Pacearchaeota archaeon]|nr:CpaF family protein [Candidatus Pacearchaeota archaeon]